MSLKVKPKQSRAKHPLPLVALGTALVLVTYVTPMATIPGTAADLGAGTTARAWILSSMSVGLAGGLLAAGLLGDRFGRRRVYTGGLLVLTIGALGCAVSWIPWAMIAFRILQGLGGAAVVACGLAILAHAHPSGPKRVHATSVWAASVGGGIAGGSLLAMLLDVGSGWREDYAATTVLGVALLIPTALALPDSRSQSPPRIDIAGLLLLGSASVFTVAALPQVRNGVNAVFAVVAVVAVVSGAAFAFVETRTRSPLVDPELVRHPRFVAATAGALTVGVGIIGMTSFLPTVAQIGFGDSLKVASVPPLVWALTSTVAATCARWLPISTEHPRTTAVLLALLAGTMLTAIRADSTLRLILPMILTGIVTGLLNSTLGKEAVASVPLDHSAMGSGANNTARYLGAACGITLFTIVATSTSQNITQGWNYAVIAAASVSLLGALVIALQALVHRRRHA